MKATGRFRESETCKAREREPSKSSSICSVLFKPNDFVQRLDIVGKERDFTDSMA